MTRKRAPIPNGSGPERPGSAVGGIVSRFLIALGLLVVLGLVQHFILRTQLATGRELIGVVNTAGRQRMLSQRIALLAHQLLAARDSAPRSLAREEMLRAIARFEEAHRALIGGDGAGKASGRLPETVAAIYFADPSRLAAQIDGFLESARRLADLPEAERRLDHADFQRIERAASGELLILLEEVVRAYQQHTESRLAGLARAQGLLAASQIGLVLVLWFAIFRPLFGRLREHVSALAELNRTLEAKVEDRTAAAEGRAVELAESSRRLREQARLLESVMNNMTESLVVVDGDGRVLLANATARRVLGEPGERGVEAWLSEHAYFQPDGVTPWPADDLPILRTLRSGRPVDAPAALLRRKGDAEALVLSTATRPLEDESGRPIGALWVARDVTRQMAAEQQLRQAQKMEAVGQLTGGLAHDFNNLLTIILGNLELLRERVEDGRERHELLDEAVEAGRRGAELTRRLLAFSRRQPLAPRRLDVNKLILDMAQILRRTLGERIALETVTAAGLWPVDADPHALEATLLNLALNARDAMPGGGRLTIETANARLDDDYASRHTEVSAGQYALIAVADTGTGIAPEVRDRVFEPFFTTKETGKGTGLGLSMAFGFVKQSGGHIKVYSEVGQGTTVKIYLPRAEEAAEERLEAEALRQGVPDPRGTETVLVIEDDAAVRRLAVAFLEELGYRTLEAADGDEALALMRQGIAVDLLFTDVVLPGGRNGRQVAEEIRRSRPATRILYTSGYTDNAIVHHGRLDASANLLQKPYSRSELARKVRAVLDQEDGGR